jgi:UDP-2,4-diacetamido-2,4,6-trideoxy-beta-L-altropyranose hydrolase
VAIRVDASHQIGTGHLRRCLALADGLAARGLQCLFICRSVDQVLRHELLRGGHELRLLPPSSEYAVSYDDALPYSKWLGVSLADDAEATLDIVRTAGIDWLITDHYGIDRRWHERMRGVVRSIMAIDDLADRGHDCDILLNQSDLTGVTARYRPLTGDSCRLLLGPRYALLRPEFALLHDNAEPPPADRPVLFVCFGGSDSKNDTAKVICALDRLDKAPSTILVLGSGHVAQDEIAEACRARPWLELHISSMKIAELMARSTLAIGAGGVMAWERLCLGLPAIVISIEHNQVEATESLDRLGLVCYLGRAESVLGATVAEAVKSIMANPSRLAEMRKKARTLVDGRGVDRVAEILMMNVRP